MNGILSFIVGIPLVAGALTGIGFLDTDQVNKEVFESVEVGIAELSPLGEEGGYAIPASASSCPTGWAYSCTSNHGGGGGKDSTTSVHCATRTCTPPPPPNVSCSLSVSPSQITEAYTGSISLTRNASPNDALFGTITYLNGTQIGATDNIDANPDVTFNVVNAFGSVAKPTTVGTHTYKQDIKGEKFDVVSGWASCSDTLTVTTGKNLAARFNPVVSGTLLEGDPVTVNGSSIENTTSINITDDFQNRYQIDVDGDGVINPRANGGNDITEATGKTTINKNTTKSAGSVTFNGLEAGTYKVRFIVDSNDDIDETSETEANNTTGWTTFTISTPPPPAEPDLYITRDPSVPSDAKEGDSITFTGGRIKNGGSANSGNFNSQYQIAIDGNTGSPEERGVGAQSLNAGTFVDVTAINPWTAVAGTHKVRLVADHNNSVDEANENNNTSTWKSFTVDPEVVDSGKNLIARQKPFVTGDLVAGGEVTFDDSYVENNGADNVTASFQNQYELDINGDGIIGSGDVTLETGQISLNAGKKSYPSAQVWSNPSAGTYQVRFRVDSDNDVSETSETEANNTTGWTVFTVDAPPADPDLYITKDPVLPSVIDVGDTITLTGGRVKNGGATDASGFTAQYQIDYNGDGTINTTRNVGQLSLSAGSFADVTGTNTWNAVAGTHKIRLVADPNDSVTEDDENNNTSTWKSFTVGRPDLIAIAPTAPTGVYSGETILFTGGTVVNQGGEDADSFQNQYEIALNQDEGNTTSRVSGVISLGAGNTSSVQTANNAWTAAPGTHKVRYIADVNNSIAESDDTNNTSAWTTFTILSPNIECSDGVDNDDPEDTLADFPSDPGCDDPNDDDETDPGETQSNLTAQGTVSVSGTLVAGETLEFSGGEIVSNGDEDVTANFNNQYQIDLYSDDDIDSDPTRATGIVEGLQVGYVAYPSSRTWTAVEGTHRIRFFADFNNSVGELDENDNATAWVSFTVTEQVDAPNVDLKVNGVEGPVSITPSEVITLTWTVTGDDPADSCSSNFTANPNVNGGSVSVTGPASGSETYTINCTNVPSGGGVGQDSEVVDVTIGDPTIDATPTRVQRGDSTDLVWDNNNNPSCTIDGNGENFTITAPGLQTTAPINNQVTYTIDCGGGLTDSVVIRVTATFEEI